VLQLEVRQFIEIVPHGRTAGRERSQNLDAGSGGIGLQFLGVVIRLKARLIHRGAVYRSLYELRRLDEVVVVIPAGRKIKTADARALDIAANETVAQRKGVVVIQLIVDARLHARAPLHSLENIQQWGCRQRIGIQRHGIDDRTVIDIILVEVQCKRSAPAEGSAQTVLELIER